MSSLESILEINSFSEWIGLQTQASRKCLESQLNDWKSDPKKLVSLSARFRRFKDAIEKNPEFYPKCESILRKIADIEKQIQKLLSATSNLEKESYGEILFLKPILQPLNFIPIILSAWAFIRVYLLPGISFLFPFLTLIAPYLLMKFAFNIPMNFNNYVNILHSLASGQFGQLLSGEIKAPSGSINIGAIFKQFGIVMVTFIQGIIQPYWTYKHLSSIDTIIYQQGKLVMEFQSLYNELQQVLEINGFTFFKCPLPPINGPRDATARVILQSNYFKLALKYIGQLEIILNMAKKSDINPVKWIKYTNKPIFRITDTFDYQVSESSRKTVSVQFSSENHALLTGPNKGGKSTVLRALSISALLAHTYGCALGKNPVMTPFTKLYVCLKPDDLPGSKSRFEREVEFTANTLKVNEPILIFIDELYHSTNPPDALRSCQIYCKQLWKRTSAISVISTHLFDLVETAPNSIQRLCCPAILNEDNSITFTYALEKGICKVSSVNELLQKNGLSVDL